MLQIRVPHTVESWLLEQTTAKVLTSYRDYCAGVTAQIFILPIPISMEENSRENFITPKTVSSGGIGPHKAIMNKNCYHLMKIPHC